MVSNQVTGDVSGRLAQVHDLNGAPVAPSGYANAGIHLGDVHLPPSTPARSHYNHQVRRIAPLNLMGRESELAELATFSTCPETTYAWWRAEAWAGKSALLSWFAMHPPENVRVVSFFITARWAGQADRKAFLDNVLEQLAELLQQDLPTLLTDSTKEFHLLGLLDEAAAACRSREEHLVLIVDGLDEDRGVTGAPTDHSIAAILPKRLPPGLKVIIAGRLNPPVPADVPPDHPLRSNSIVHRLSSSSAAQAIRAEMERELLRLTAGAVERDLLGLVTAAGGGLTAADLAELTGLPHWQVDNQLSTVTGRSFQRRDSSPADIYLLGHEELHVTATEVLANELPRYHDRLQRWAESYRARGWPKETPTFLLLDYCAALLASGRLKQAVSLSTDMRRQDRLLDFHGGDSQALNELNAVLEAMATGPHPDLISMVRPVLQREHLAIRNRSIPHRLPVVWALLGHADRAVSLARSMSTHSYEAGDRALALIGVAEVLDDRDLASSLLREAEKVVDRLCGSSDLGDFGQWLWQPLALAAVRIGDSPRALRLLDRISGTEHLVSALCAVATEVWTTDHGNRHAQLLSRAEAEVREVDDITRRVRLKRDLIEAWAKTGDVLRAERLARTLRGNRHRGRQWLPIAKAAAASGDVRRAAEILDEAERLISSMPKACNRAWAWPELVEASAAVGDDIRARRVATLAAQEKAEPGVGLIRALCRLGQLEDALSLTLEQLYREPRVRALTSIACAAAEQGRFADVDDLLARDDFLRNNASALVEVAEAAARLGERDRAEAWLKAAKSLTHVTRTAEELRGLVCAAAAQGRFDLSETVTELVNDTAEKARLWQAAAAIAIEKDDRKQVSSYADRAFEWAIQTRSNDVLLATVELMCSLGLLREAKLALEHHSHRTRVALAIDAGDVPVASAYMVLAKTQARSGFWHEARKSLARAQWIIEGASRNTVGDDTGIHQLAEAWMEVGGVDAVRKLAASSSPGSQFDRYPDLLIAVEAARGGRIEEAESTARSFRLNLDKDTIRVALADAAIEQGEFDSAETIVRSLVPQLRQLAAERLAKAMLAAGHHERARDLVFFVIADRSNKTPLRALIADPDPSRRTAAIAHVLLNGAWTDAIKELIATEPDALELTVQELVKMTRRTSMDQHS